MGDDKPKLRSQLNQVLVPKERVISRGQGCWNCLTGDSLILAQRGCIRLDEAERPTLVLGRDGWEPSDAWRSVSAMEIVEVITTYGARLRMTLDHRVFTDRGWIAACDLRPSAGSGRTSNYLAGDEVVTMPEVVHYSNEIEHAEAELLGAITGDGWVMPNKGVGFGFSANRLDAWRDLLVYAGERFNSREQPHIKNRKLNNFFQLEWRTAAAREWAAQLDKQHIPPSIWRSTPSVIGAYLRGLFTTDGTLGDCGVVLYQVTRSLIDEVQLIMRTLGIQSHRRVELRQLPHHDLYSLAINRVDSLRRFAELAGFKDQRRNQKLATFLSRRAVDTPERIRSVTPAGVADVYDISVPTTESFFANGMLVHNCKHWDREKAKPLWTNNRQNDLKTALEISLKSPNGEDDVRVHNIRKMVNDLDHLVASGHMGVCLGGGRTADGKPVGDLVAHAFLCDRWSGVQGASLATGGKTDPLPEELHEKLDKKPN